jgi:sigma-B regulation protein RsbU (phosphoserine phosphatase)
MIEVPAELQGSRILVVDDMPANLDVLCHALEGVGYQVQVAPGGELALKVAASSTPELILLDVRMPGLDGYEVCRRLKEDSRTQATPVIFVTANDQTEDLVAGFRAGGVDYIAKPFREQEVLVRVHNALYTRHLFEQNRAYQEKMKKELQTAHDMQMGLMPKEQPQVEGYEIAGRCLPAEQVGGDFFQYFEMRGGGLALCVADATGHAMEAAIPVVLFSGMLETQMEMGGSLEELFARLNRSLCRILKARTRICLVMGQLEVQGRTLRLANAGCPYPYHYQTESGRIVELEMTAYPLGVHPETRYAVLEVKLEPGDRVVFCSDGVVEAENRAGEIFGYERTAETIRKGCEKRLPARDLMEYLIQTSNAFAGHVPAIDDQTCVVLAVEGRSCP